MNLQRLLSTWWRIMTRPSVPTLEEARQKVDLSAALIGFVLVELITTVVRSIWVQPLPVPVAPAETPPLFRFLWDHLLLREFVFFVFSILGIVFLSFFFLIGGLLVTGRGRFKDYLHLFALFEAPLGLLGVALDRIPALPPWVVSVITGVYFAILTVQTLRVIHGFRLPRALLTFGVSMVVMVVLSLVFGLAVAGPLLYMFETVFQ